MQTNPETLLKTTRGLFLVNAVFWLAFGIAGFYRGISGLDSNPSLRLTLSGLMLANGVVMILLANWIKSATRTAFMAAIIYVAVNVVLSITDQVGFVDVLILFLNISLLGMLFITRRRLNQAG